jgi:hypothetical protein
MDDTEKLKIRNAINQNLQHSIEQLGITDPVEKLQHYERVCIAILDSANEEDETELTILLDEFLDDKAAELGVVR